jgi:N-methylhydantoinase B
MNVNPIVSEIIFGGLWALEEEVEELLARIWRSSTLRDTGDFSVAIFDRFGRALTGRRLGAGPAALLARFPPETMNEGDVFLHNDPYFSPLGLGELADLYLTMPLFADGRILAFLEVRGRHDDLGGVKPGGGSSSANESFHEGLLIPPMRIVKGGQIVEDILTLLQRNSRVSPVLENDIKGQIGALRIGSVRLRELSDRYGVEQLSACFADILRNCEVAFKTKIISQLPEGNWEVEAPIDIDGLDAPHRLRLALERKGDRIIIDLNGTSPQTKRPINCPLEGPGRIFLARLLSPLMLNLSPEPQHFIENAGLNDGACRAFDVRLPGPGTLLTPCFPAPTGLRFLTLNKLLSVFGEALFYANENRCSAGFDSLRSWSLREKAKDGESSIFFREALGSGMGGNALSDGISAAPPIGGNGGMPVEMIEAHYPLRVESSGLLIDSGGPGNHRGGLGMFREYRFLTKCEVSSAAFSEKTGPFGVCGGIPGGTYRFIISRDGKKMKKLASTCEGETVSEGDLLRLETPGGGGWGNPAERDPESVRLDVCRGFVSPGSAGRIFRVSLKGKENPTVDGKKSAVLRTNSEN